jgi:DNA-directed RNA polymerase specialized sigma24 family protein
MAARRPGVPAEDLTAVLRVHADRVHDAVRRLGVDAATAVEVVEASALALVDTVTERPQDVPDAVGWWFAAARRMARGARAAQPDLPIGGGLLSSDDDQLVLAEALEDLPEEQRLAVLVRDSYRLPWTAVAVALELPEERAARLVARSRLAAVPLLDDEPAPSPLHDERLAALARLGEAGRDAPGDATARRHVKACASCDAVVASQERVSLLLSGLAVVALPPDVRTVLLDHVEDEARRRLPTAASLVLTEEELDDWDDDPRVLPPVLAVAGVLLAVLLGLGVGLLLSRGGGAVLSSSGGLPAVSLPPVQPPAPLQLPDLPPAEPVPTPRTTVFFLPPPTPSPSPTPQETSPAEPTAPPSSTASSAVVQVDPRSGPNGATLRVTGSGWEPSSRVVVDYLDPTGRPTGSRTTADVDDDGRFTTSLVARDPTGLPGPHEVRASSASTTRSATYDARA